MQKATLQHGLDQPQPARQRNGNPSFESLQGGRFAQLQAMADGSPRTAGLAQLAAAVDESPALAAQRALVGKIHDSPRMAFQAHPHGDALSKAAPIQRRATYGQAGWQAAVVNYRALHTSQTLDGETLVKPYPGVGQNVGVILAGSSNVGTVHASNFDEGYHSEPGLITRSQGEGGNQWADANRAINMRNLSAEGNAMIQNDINMNGDEQVAPRYDGFTIYTERHPCATTCDTTANLRNDRYKDNIDYVHWSTPNDANAPNTIAAWMLPRVRAINPALEWRIGTYGQYNTVGFYGKRVL
ncbi:MAG TPA: hypothetical protein VF811_00585 [Parasulfuritortus sp.]